MAFIGYINLKLNCTSHKILDAFVTAATSSKIIQQQSFAINNLQVQHIKKIRIPFRVHYEVT